MPGRASSGFDRSASRPLSPSNVIPDQTRSLGGFGRVAWFERRGPRRRRPGRRGAPPFAQSALSPRRSRRMTGSLGRAGCGWSQAGPLGILPSEWPSRAGRTGLAAPPSQSWPADSFDCLAAGWHLAETESRRTVEGKAPDRGSSHGNKAIQISGGENDADNPGSPGRHATAPRSPRWRHPDLLVWAGPRARPASPLPSVWPGAGSALPRRLLSPGSLDTSGALRSSLQEAATHLLSGGTMNTHTTRRHRPRTGDFVPERRRYTRSAAIRLASDPALRYEQVMLGGR